MKHWFARYWPIAGVFAWILGVELWAILTGHKTISERVWQGRRRGGRLVTVLAVAVVAFLMWHLFFGLGEPDSQQAAPDPCTQAEDF